MAKQFFPKIGAVHYEGPDSKRPLAFKHYNPDELVEGKTMRDHLRFSAVYWHTMSGSATACRSWNTGECTTREAIARAHAFFEFAGKLGIPFYAWHYRDLASHGKSLRDANTQLDAVARELQKLQRDTGIRLLWGTAQNFVHPRYMHGAATSRNADVFCFAAAQVKKALEWTHELGGAGYVFWGGREDYSSLINTDLKREMDHLARFMHMAVAYKKKIGFKGPFWIEPEPKEPTRHQYDSDAAACLNFLREYGLLEHFQLNLEVNHAWLAGHTMEHEVAVAAGALGSISANMGDYFLGWDTDQFPADLYLTAKTMLGILKHGGLSRGGVNLDAKMRRESFNPEDLFYAHIAGMDSFARGLKIAAKLRADGRLDASIKSRHRSWGEGLGAEIEAGKATLADCEKHALALGEVKNLESGRQEPLEAIFNEFIRVRSNLGSPTATPAASSVTPKSPAVATGQTRLSRFKARMRRGEASKALSTGDEDHSHAHAHSKTFKVTKQTSARSSHGRQAPATAKQSPREKNHKFASNNSSWKIISRLARTIARVMIKHTHTRHIKNDLNIIYACTWATIHHLLHVSLAVCGLPSWQLTLSYYVSTFLFSLSLSSIAINAVIAALHNNFPTHFWASSSKPRIPCRK